MWMSVLLRRKGQPTLGRMMKPTKKGFVKNHTDTKGELQVCIVNQYRREGGSRGKFPGLGSQEGPAKFVSDGGAK